MEIRRNVSLRFLDTKEYPLKKERERERKYMHAKGGSSLPNHEVYYFEFVT